MKYLLLTSVGYIKIELLSGKMNWFKGTFFIANLVSFMISWCINYIEIVFYHFINMKTNFIYEIATKFDELSSHIWNMIVFLR